MRDGDGDGRGARVHGVYSASGLVFILVGVGEIVQADAGVIFSRSEA